jgi:hypothetical protein
MRRAFLTASIATWLIFTISTAPAAVIASWSFEGLSVSTTPGITPVPTAGSLAADLGTGTLSGIHGANSTWSTPAGNASTRSLSVNTWSVGDVWEFTADTTGFAGIQLLFDATRSSTGPTDFKVQYSLTGPAGSFVDLPGGAYTLAAIRFSTTGNPNVNTPPRFYFDLGSINGLDNNPNAAFRLAATAGGSGTSGTSRIDNVTVGTNLIPEPSAALLIAPLLVFRRRR